MQLSNNIRRHGAYGRSKTWADSKQTNWGMEAHAPLNFLV